MTRVLWPVYTFRDYQRVVVAVFLDWVTSVEFIMHPERFGADAANYYQARPLHIVAPEDQLTETQGDPLRGLGEAA